MDLLNTDWQFMSTILRCRDLCRCLGVPLTGAAVCKVAVDCGVDVDAGILTVRGV